MPSLDVERSSDLEAMQGGFTITSPPSRARSSYPGAKCYIDLAIQESPQNPAAAWFFQPKPKILDSLLKVRVGGSFIWPPPGILPSQVKRLVFVAGGVGINPLMSILSHLDSERLFPDNVRFIYSCRLPLSGQMEKILFLDRLRAIFSTARRKQHRKTFIRQELDLYLTGTTLENQARIHDKAVRNYAICGRIGVFERRFTTEEIVESLGPEVERDGTVAYICGPPSMTDEVVEALRKAEGMADERVLCEKWW